jgi:hypothetical protein
VVEATLEYIGPMAERPRYNMGDPSQDNVVLDYRKVRITGVRPWQDALSVDRRLPFGNGIFRHYPELDGS